MLLALEGDLVVSARAYGRNLTFPGYERLCIALKAGK
jgi:hypothetical protein